MENSLASTSAADGGLNRWSQSLPKVICAYNRTHHRTTGFAPAVVLYSDICDKLEDVPEQYRDLLQQELSKFDSWKSMKLYVHAKSEVCALD